MLVSETLIAKLLHPIDLYCERIDTSFFAEPYGLLSNLAFFPAALGIYWLARRSSEVQVRRRLSILALLAMLIGIGSGLFHAIPNVLTMTADVTPITGFALVFVLFYFAFLREEQSYVPTKFTISIALIVLPGLIVNLSGFSHYVAGGEFYLGLPLTMLYLGSTDLQRRRGRILLVGAGIFSLAFAARTLDLPLCEVLPNGTHFLWHLINAGVVWILAYALHASEAEV